VVLKISVVWVEEVELCVPEGDCDGFVVDFAACREEGEEVCAAARYPSRVLVVVRPEDGFVDE
jgi:hypothetical protein